MRLRGLLVNAVGALTAVAVLTGLTTVTVVAVAGSAAAASPEPADPLGLSSDGVDFSESLTEPLFDPDVRWVPGDVRTASFYVRNDAADGGSLQVAIRRVLRNDLIDSTWLAVSARAGANPFTTVTSGERATLVDNVAVASGEVVRVRVRVELLPDAPNTTQVLSSDIDLKVRLSDDRAISPIPPAAGGGGGTPSAPGGSNGSAPDRGGPDAGDPNAIAGFLPDTGTTVRPWLLPLALLFISVGALLMARRYRDEDDDPDLDGTADSLRGT